VDLWDYTRTDPIHSFEWGCDNIHCVRFNRVEYDVLATCASDRSIVLYDIRKQTPIRKLVMQMSTNDLSWNPMEAFNFTTACEDQNCYTFDMRNLDLALNVHRDHTAAVMTVDYSPTGTEFVTGSWDRSMRIFPVHSGNSREIYHTKRMQRIMAVRWSGDAQYVMSGSDDMNLRVWKVSASRPVRQMVPRERNQYEYRQKLKDRYRHHEQIGRILRHRHLPLAIHNARKLRHTKRTAEREKERRRRVHSKPEKVLESLQSERQKHIVRQIE